VEHVGDLGLVRLVDELGRAHALPAHPHVERAIRLEGETAIGAVDLHRGDANIERHPIDRPDPPRIQGFRHLREAPGNQCQPTPRFLFQRLPFRDCVGISVEGDDVRALRENGARIAARAEGPVDMRLAGPGIEPGDHLVEEHGDVAFGGGAHALPPRSASCWSRSARMRGFALGEAR
jgi:hypothetical protein